MNATLPGAAPRDETAKNDVAVPQGSVGGAGGNPGEISGAMRFQQKAPSQVGPGDLTVAYTVGPMEMQRVVDGFLSPSRTVAHPAIGVYCKDHSGSGALIASVQADSPAEQAKLHAGDVIEQIGPFVIKDQFDFAKAMLKQKVGGRVDFKIVRSGTEMTIQVIVGQGAG